MSIFLLEEYIKKIIKEEKNSTTILHVFDFDMTLYDPNKEEWINEVLEELYRSINNPSIRTILCTARSDKNSIIKDTELILNEKGISLFNESEYENTFDKYYFKPESERISVPKYKSNVITQEALSNGVDVVKFWDDRKDSLKEAEKSLSDYRIEYYQVDTNLYSEA